jgi:uncharacterized membrane protein HdeD (DUF308 family)
MSDIGDTSGLRGLGNAHIARNWGWFVALGVALLAAGVFALGDVVAVTLVSVIFIGAVLLVGGVAQIIHAFMTKGWSAFALNLVGGIFYVAGGILIMQEPVRGSIVITILLLIAICVGGITRIVIAFRNRELASWWILALGGAASVAIGIVLYASLPWSGLWVLGTLVGIELLVQGCTWLQLGLTLRRLRRKVASG